MKLGTLLLFSENESVLTTLFFFGNLLEVLVNDSNSKHNTSSRTNSTHEVSKDAQSTDANTTESSSSCNVAAQIANHRFLTEATFKHHVLIHQLASNVTGCGSRHINPDAGEERARTHNKEAIEEAVEGVTEDVGPGARRRNVVSQTTDRSRVTLHVILLPLAKEANEKVALELAVKHLREEVQVGDEGCLQNDRDVRSIEQLDWVRSLVATNTFGGNSQFDAETLEVNNN